LTTCSTPDSLSKAGILCGNTIVRAIDDVSVLVLLAAILSHDTGGDVVAVVSLSS
jgi:hypothetical protein